MKTLALFACFACFAVQAATFSWDASPSTNATAYALCWGTNAGGPYPTRTNVGPALTFTITNNLFAGQTTYFVCVALDTNNWLESDPSNEVSLTLPPRPLPPHQNALQVAGTWQTAPDPHGPWCDESIISVLSVPFTPSRQFVRAQLQVVP